MLDKNCESAIPRFGQQNQGRSMPVCAPKLNEDRRTLQSEIEASRQLRSELEVCISALYEKLIPILAMDELPSPPTPPRESPCNLIEVVARNNEDLHDLACSLRRLNNRILL